MTELEYIENINELEAKFSRVLNAFNILFLELNSTKKQLVKKTIVLAENRDLINEYNSMLSDSFNENYQLEEEIEILQKRLAAAEKKNVKITSSNSSLPPSKDLNKEKRTNNRKKSGKKLGGQPGHKGQTLELSENPDKITECLPDDNCPACGKPLDFDTKKLVKVKQEVDIPPIKAFVEQFEQYEVPCPCGHICVGKFPDRIKAKVQYGARTRSMISYLSVFQYLPFQRMKDLFLTCFGMHISKGTLCNTIKRSAKLYKNAYRLIKDFLQNSDIIGADETHITINGEKGYFWVWQNAKVTFIACENSRKQENIDKHFPNGFPYAVIISDRYAPQLNTPAKDHQICWVHILRDLKLLIEKEDNPWIHKLRKLFDKAEKLDLEKKCWTKDDKKAKKLELEFDKLLDAKIDKGKFEKTEKLRKSLIRNRPFLLTFLYYEGVPFHNNDSERAIRNAKVKMNISLQFKAGGQSYAIIRSVVDTLIKNNLPIFDTLFMLEQGQEVDLGLSA